MGLFCCFGSSTDSVKSSNNNNNNNNNKANQVEEAPVIPAPFTGTRTWQADAAWTEFLARPPPSSQDGASATTLAHRAVQYINTIYPLPAATGTISTHEPVVRQTMAPDGTDFKFAIQDAIVLDHDYTGIMFAKVSIVQFPPDQATSEIHIAETIEIVKQADALFLSTMEQDGICVRHARMHVFVGDVALTAVFRPDLTASGPDGEMPAPTVKAMHSEYAEGLAEKNDKMAEEERRKARQAWREKSPEGKFRSWNFMLAMRVLQQAVPGCTLWDEGTLQDCVGGGQTRMEDDAWRKVPTRVLVARWFKPPHAETEEEKEDDAHGADVWRITMTNGDEAGAEERELGVSKLLKMKKGQDGQVKTTGGEIVAVTVVVGTPLSDTWPKSGTYTKHAALKAAQETAVELVRRWHRQGKTSRCMIRVCMGAEQIRTKFVGEPWEVAAVSEMGTPSAAATLTEDKTTEQEDGQFLRDFYMHVRPDAEHNLFESEVQFQAVKQHMMQRMAADPARFIAMAPQIAAASANTMMEMNFPGCEISFGEEIFPYPSESAREAVSPHMTFMVVARDPKLGKDKNDVVCVLHVVPLPGPATSDFLALQQRNWLESPEMKGAEGALLEVLKRWYKEDKLADDCMAQVMMATDATIYRFVDGERFEDYPEERMAQLRFG